MRQWCWALNRDITPEVETSPTTPHKGPAQHTMLNKTNSHQYWCTEAPGSSHRIPKETLAILFPDDDDEYSGVVVFLQMSYLNVHVSMLVCVSVCNVTQLCIFLHHLGEGGGGGGDNVQWLTLAPNHSAVSWSHNEYNVST